MFEVKYSNLKINSFINNYLLITGHLYNNIRLSPRDEEKLVFVAQNEARKQVIFSGSLHFTMTDGYQQL